MNYARMNSVRAGFTLVEVLAALTILTIGLGSVLYIVLSSTRTGELASDRNNAAVIIPEAIADIERMHLITPAMAQQAGLTPDYAGELMDSLNLGFTDPAAEKNPYDNVIMTVSDSTGKVQQSFPLQNLACKNLVVDPITGKVSPMHNLMYWPLDKKNSRVMGQFPVQPTVNPLLNNHGVAYRGLYKLEPHPEWFVNRLTLNPASPFAGVYILSFVLYRDLDPAKPTTDPTKKLQQISDPVIVYLHDKKVR